MITYLIIFVTLSVSAAYGLSNETSEVGKEEKD